MLAWILLMALLVWHVASMTRTMRRRMHLSNYIIYLLVDDDIRADQKKKLEEWIPTSGAANASQLYSMTRSALESYIEGWAKASGAPILATQSKLWETDAAGLLPHRQGEN